VRLLESAGFRNVREYVGGMEDWTAGGGAVRGIGSVEAAAQNLVAARGGSRARSLSPGTGLARAFVWIAEQSYGRVFQCWLAIVVVSGFLYWAPAHFGRVALEGPSGAIGADANGLLSSLYFSFVTATSVGYGDIRPVGLLRWLAVTEGALGLLVFGSVISKLVSHRQDLVIEELHRTSFEARLSRVRTNLHLVLTDLQTLGDLCADGNITEARLLPRLESGAVVLTGELRAVHDLLFRPQELPEEAVFSSILSSLAAILRELQALRSGAPQPSPSSPALKASLASIQKHAGEICGECVPRQYAPTLRACMDEVQVLATAIR